MASEYPAIVILGIDPEKHQIPPLLEHHMAKMQKDFPVLFVEIIDSLTMEQLKVVMKEVGYVPKELPPKKSIITAEDNTIPFPKAKIVMP